MRKELLILHSLVLLASLVPLAVKKITIPALETVLFRTAIAFVILALIVLVRRLPVKVSYRAFWQLLATGALTALYWILVIISTRLANASVCLVGLATIPLWVSFIAPILSKKKINFYQIVTGLNAIFGMYMIFSSGFTYNVGLTSAILAAFFAAFVTVINSRLSKKYDSFVLNMYEMLGAALGTVMCLPLYFYLAPDGTRLNFSPTTSDVILLILLALIFSVLVNVLIIQLMRKIQPFTIALTNNLSPIYGILAALLIDGQSEMMNIYFYSGATIIIASVTAYPIVSFFFKDEALNRKSDAVIKT